MSTNIWQRSKISSLWHIREYVRPYRRTVIFGLVAAMVGELTALVIPLLTGRVIDGPIKHGDRGALIPLGILALAFGIADAGLVFIRRWTMRRASLGLETDVRNDLYNHLQKLPVAFHDRWQSGQLLSRATSDLSAIRRFVAFGLIYLVVNSVIFIVVAAMLIYTYPPLGLLVTVLCVPLAWVSIKFERLYKKQSRRVQDQQGEVATAVEESALGIRVIKSFGRRRMLYDRFDEQARTLRTDQLAKVHTLAMVWAIIEAHPQLVLGVVAFVGIIATAHGAITLGTLVAFVSLFQLALWPIMSLGWLLANAQEAISAADRIYDVLHTEPSIVDSPQAAALERPTGRLVFEHVGFTYPDSDEPVLHGIDLTVEPGETLALVGPVGCGKSTLTALVSRLYDVTEGRITIDGRDIRDLPLDNLREVVATAFEEPILFSASAHENITLGRPEATDPEVREAIELAQADFVDDLPWGLDTRLGEQGMSVSGGQRQRLALARAVVARPTVLVLDDPLSALDVHTEALVEEALRRVLAHTTSIVVAHRPSTVLLADRVALLDGGTITAIGTHHELLQTVPAYRAILSQDADLEEVDR
ncbi:MAG TPA: ABC transporter ATP-binding protein [Mycobacteriales bacterium]|nr:ABC transporter ATP-binding protein [Mycobacteriales bacterium]